MIIGLVGWIGSGKDTAANFLVDAFNFRQESFAASLKDAISVIFGWPREMLEGKTKEARAQREMVDEWWAKRLGIPHLSPRWVLQYWGTEVCRIGFHDAIWIASLENRLRNSTENVVISDCRFPNEIQAIRNSGGKIIWVQRGELPDWYAIAAEANIGDIACQRELTNLGIHASETSWIGTNFDSVIKNDGTIDELYEKISKSLELKEMVSMQDEYPLTQFDSLHR